MSRGTTEGSLCVYMHARVGGLCLLSYIAELESLWEVILLRNIVIGDTRQRRDALGTASEDAREVCDHSVGEWFGFEAAVVSWN